jgi:hypothetical protein
MPRIGVLFGIARSASAEPSIHALVEGLQNYGYTEDHNIQIQLRFATQTGTDLPTLAAELVRLQVDVILANGTQPTQAAQQATRTIPIVGMYVLIRSPPGLLRTWPGQVATSPPSATSVRRLLANGWSCFSESFLV